MTEEIIAQQQYPDIPLMHQRNEDSSPRFPHLISFQNHQTWRKIRNYQQGASHRADQSSNRDNISRSQNESRNRHRCPSNSNRRRGGSRTRRSTRNGRGSPYGLETVNSLDSEQPSNKILGALGSRIGATFHAVQPKHASADEAKQEEEVPQGVQEEEAEDNNHHNLWKNRSSCIS